MTVAEWLAAAKADARARGLEALVPLLERLAESTRELRRADWNDTAAGPRTIAGPLNGSTGRTSDG